VRSHLREIFWRVAVVSTRPTVEGRSVLDPFHPLGIVKRVNKKPLRCFTNDCFLKVLGVRPLSQASSARGRFGWSVRWSRVFGVGSRLRRKLGCVIRAALRGERDALTAARHTASTCHVDKRIASAWKLVTVATQGTSHPAHPPDTVRHGGSDASRALSRAEPVGGWCGVCVSPPQIQAAAAAGWIEYTVGVPVEVEGKTVEKKVETELLKELESHYNSELSSKVAREWNARRQVRGSIRPFVFRTLPLGFARL
jgi:hypothetical protein